MITASAKRFSRGDIEISTEDEQGLARIHARRDELGEIGRAFSALVQYMREKSETARLVDQGRLNLDVRPVSPQDALGLALEEMVASPKRRPMCQLRPDHPGRPEFERYFSPKMNGPWVFAGY